VRDGGKERLPTFNPRPDGCAKTLARANWRSPTSTSPKHQLLSPAANNSTHLSGTTITMPLPRTVALTRVAKSLPQSSPLSTSQRTFVRGFSYTKERKAADHAHEDHYDPPSGWLFGVKPGEKAEKEGWETVWIWGFFGSLGLGVVAYAFKPDTS
jgi:hypothetical protein